MTIAVKEHMDKTALIVGASGVTAAQLTRDGWRAEGLARNPVAQDGVVPIVADIEERARGGVGRG